MAEMKVFIAMTIATELVEHLDIFEYWTTSEVNSTPFFSSMMPRDRFWLLMWFFHLADNNQQVQRGMADGNTLSNSDGFTRTLWVPLEVCFRPISIYPWMKEWFHVEKIFSSVFTTLTSWRNTESRLTCCAMLWLGIVHASNSTPENQTYLQVWMELHIILLWTWCEGILASATFFTWTITTVHHTCTWTCSYLDVAQQRHSNFWT